MKKPVIFRYALLIAAAWLILAQSFAAPSVREYYELKIYSLASKSQEAKTDAFLKDVFIPAMHRAGVMRVGVFKPVESDTLNGKRIYVLIPYRSPEHFFKMTDILQNDKVYQEAGKSFLDAPFNDPPFSRVESILMKSFRDMPEAVAPKFTTPVNDRIYELRAYESATEAKAGKKIEMFNQGGEIRLFQKLDFNIVFFGQVMAGDMMPNLMYMTSFQDTTANRLHWKAFGDSPEWKTLSGMEEYKNTVSRIHKYMLHPAPYSEF